VAAGPLGRGKASAAAVSMRREKTSRAMARVATKTDPADAELTTECGGRRDMGSTSARGHERALPPRFARELAACRRVSKRRDDAIEDGVGNLIGERVFEKSRWRACDEDRARRWEIHGAIIFRLYACCRFRFHPALDCLPGRRCGNCGPQTRSGSSGDRTSATCTRFDFGHAQPGPAQIYLRFQLLARTAKR